MKLASIGSDGLSNSRNNNQKLNNLSFKQDILPWRVEGCCKNQKDEQALVKAFEMALKEMPNIALKRNEIYQILKNPIHSSILKSDYDLPGKLSGFLQN